MNRRRAYGLNPRLVGCTLRLTFANRRPLETPTPDDDRTNARGIEIRFHVSRRFIPWPLGHLWFPVA
jgi:hypothetical protein